MSGVFKVFLILFKKMALTICFIGGISTLTLTAGTTYNRIVYQYNWFQSFFRTILWPFEATNWAEGFSEVNFRNIRTGMTKPDVINLVGQPLSKECSEQFNECTWYYATREADAQLFDKRELYLSRTGIVIGTTSEFYID